MTTVSEAVKSILAHIVRQAAVLAGASMVALWIADEGALASCGSRRPRTHPRVTTCRLLASLSARVEWAGLPLSADHSKSMTCSPILALSAKISRGRCG